MKASATIERTKTEQHRERLTELHVMQRQIPRELAEAEAQLKGARDAERFARQNAQRIRALAEIGQASTSELKAIEHAVGVAGEDLRAAEDRLGTITEKLPALAAAIADTTEAYRAERVPALLDTGKRAADRIDQAWRELLAAFEAGDVITTEIKRDFSTVTNASGYTAIDSRVPHALPAALGFGVKQRIAALAERWRALRERV